MISNIDIARNKTKVYAKDNYTSTIIEKLAHLEHFDNKVIRSSKFTKNMAKIVKKYESGAITFRMRIFNYRYRELLMKKFNSFGFTCVLLYDFISHEFFFKNR